MSPWAAVVDGIHVLPVLHEALEFADLARAAFRRLQPDAVAVEVPSSLEQPWLRAIDRLPSISVMLYETADGRTLYLPIHPADALVEAARSAREAGVPVRCVDLDVDGYADYRDPVPDPYAILRIGAAAFLRGLAGQARPRDPADARREAAMAFHARRLRDEGAERVLLLCGLHHAGPLAEQLRRDQAEPLTPPRRKNVRLVHLHPESLGEVLGATPFHVAVYEARRLGRPDEPEGDAAPDREPVQLVERPTGPFRILSGGAATGDSSSDADAVDRAVRRSFDRAIAADDPIPPLDRLDNHQALLAETERRLAASAPDEEVRRWQRMNLARFSRNLALASGMLVPDLYDLIAAARACVSDNFAWELHRLAVAYPEQAERAADLPTARIRADEIFDGTRRLRLERRTRRPKRPDWRSLLRQRRAERFPGEWLQGFDGDAICSYPPEDVVIEDFGRYLRRKGRSVLSEERSRTVPFSTSLLDGIDVRETIRHWTEGTIYVRELGRAPGGVGSLVVIFDEDEDERTPRFPYAQTWLGEHDQESDMAFYSTEPALGVVGPGICRVTYGGLLMSYPPQRMLDVWSDPDYRRAERKSEVLLLAALDYCSEKVVVHVSARPPRAIFHQLASRLGLKILYLPLGSMSPTTLRRIRVMHILSGHDKREIARDYVW